MGKEAIDIYDHVDKKRVEGVLFGTYPPARDLKVIKLPKLARYDQILKNFAASKRMTIQVILV